MLKPRLRDSKKLSTRELYPLNEIPDDIIRRIGSYIVYLIYTGRNDISGSEWSQAFADSIGGKYLVSPVGIADVEMGKNCWSMKTVKDKDPHKKKKIRIISGRCSPDYSFMITDPHKDVKKTGRAVLGIWNERVNIATDNYSQVRTAILIRSNDLSSYTLFEEETRRYPTNAIKWNVNKNGNLCGFNSKGHQMFTWQPHGSQFTIHTEVPEDAVRFSIKIPEKSLTKEDVLKTIKYDDSWITIIK